MSLVAGVDSSTQSCKVLIVDTESSKVVRQGSAKHPAGTQVDPQCWWHSLLEAIEDAGGIDDVQAISVAGQQHGMVCLDKNGEVIRPALLWNDTRSADSAQDLIAELGQGDYQAGKTQWIQAVGSAPVASLTVSKLRWLADNEPENVSKISAICLPHDYLTYKLSANSDLITDRSDASGTGYVDRFTATYRLDLLALALKISQAQAEKIRLPKICEPFEVATVACLEKIKAEIATYKGSPAQHHCDENCKTIPVGAGAGDNAAAALALDLQVGQASLSLGTSGVVAVVSDKSVADDTAVVNGFMDASGKWLPLACTLNASRIIDAMATVLSVDYENYSELALKASSGSQGLKLTPYFEGERTPNLPNATATLEGMTLANFTRENFARAGVEGLLTLMKGALEAIQQLGVDVHTVKLIGGGAKLRAVQELAPSILGVKVEVPPVMEYVAYGAAIQAKKLLEQLGTK